mmetsp:Transcript_36808/g.52023  ORF Transcript_36808/g.52023 Transcript_36808/m.52023 type:complete len:125 (+) Transcript_36808:95-469(+)
MFLIGHYHPQFFNGSKPVLSEVFFIEGESSISEVVVLAAEVVYFCLTIRSLIACQSVANDVAINPTSMMAYKTRQYVQIASIPPPLVFPTYQRRGIPKIQRTTITTVAISNCFPRARRRPLLKP